MRAPKKHDVQSNKSPRRRMRAFAVDGSRLRSLRATRGWTQIEAAARAGLSERLLRKAENGEPIELQSISILSQLYSTPAAPLTPNDLLVSPRPSPQAAQIEAVVRRWYDELWNKGRFEIIDELASPDGVLHAQGDALDLMAARERFIAMRTAFHDFEFAIDHLTVQDDVAVVRWHVRLTHVGPWMGRPPSGKRFTIEGSSWVRVTDGRLREGWDYWDQEQVSRALNEGKPRRGR